jgi:SepF-like predicted cell division protein (DUF552 family)
MKNFFSKAKDKLIKGAGKGDDYYPDEISDDYVEIEAESARKGKEKILIRPYIVEDFTDIKPALDALREGMTVALVNIKPIKDRDIVELKRAVNKLKKTCDAIDGDIAGFGEDWIVVTPGFARVYRTTQTEDVEEE